MFCNHCGKQVDNDTVFCPYCGGRVGDAPVQKQAPQYAAPPQPAQPAPPQENTIAIVGFIFSFFAYGAIIGLICSIIGFNNAKKGAPHKNLALAGIIISAIAIAGSILGTVIYAVFVVNYIGAIGSIAGGMGDYYGIIASML